MSENTNTNNNNNNNTGRGNGRGNSGRGNFRGRGTAGGRGHGRNNTRNNNNRNNRSTNNKSSQVKGAVEELGKHVFDCSSRKNIEECAETLKQIAIYVGNNYGKYANQIKYVVEELEDPNIEEPEEITEEEQEDQLKMFRYKEEMKRYLDKLEGFEAGKQRLYTLVWGQCTKAMIGEIKALPNYATLHGNQDPIALIQGIKGIIYSFRDHKYIHGNIWRAYRALFNTVQKEDEDLKAFHERFENQVDVVEKYVGRIPIADYLYDRDEDFLSLTRRQQGEEEYILEAKNRSKEKLLGYGLLANMDKKRHGNLVEDLENQYTFGDNKYPVTPQRSYEYAKNYKQYKPKKPNNNGGGQRDGLSFTTRGSGRGGRGGRGSQRSCYGDRCYGNCDNPECTAPGLANRNNNNNNSNNNSRGTTNTTVNSDNNNNNGTQNGVQMFTVTNNGAQNTDEYVESGFNFHTVVANNREKASEEYIFKHQLKNKTNKNLKQWLLFDTASTTHLVSNPKLVNNICTNSHSQGVISNGGQLDIKETATLNGVGDVPFSEEGIANLLSMAKLIDDGFRIFIDTDIEDAIFVYTPNGRVNKFIRSKNGLYYHDTTNRKDISFMNSQLENSQIYTRRQIQRAREARNLYQMLAYPSINDFKNAIKYNYIKDCPTTIEDIVIAEDIFGKDIYALKGKTVRKTPYRVEMDTIEIPQEILKLHNNVILGIDYMFVNGIAFFVTIASKIKFGTVECATSMSNKMTFQYLDSVIKMYNSRGFRIQTILGDDQFEPLKSVLAEKYNIKFNPTSAFEHVSEVERHIRTIKERVRASLSSFPWKKAIPRVIVKETVKHCMKMLNAIPPKSGLTTQLSPRNIVTGKTLNYKHHFKMPIGDYAQVHEEEQPRNSMAERTLGAICLGPIDNVQGGYKFMSLRTGKMIKRYAWTPIPMTQEVIDRVLSFGEQENVPEGVIIRDIQGNVEVNEFEYDDIEGVYGYDLQQNLYPTIQNNQNNQEETDNEDDVTNTSSTSNDDDDNDEDDDKVEILQNKNDPEPNETVIEDMEGEIDNEIESIVQDIEDAMDTEIEEFNNINEDLDNTIESMERAHETDETPVKRNRKPVSRYEPSFKNISYTQIKGVIPNNNIDDITFVQVLYKVFQQMSLNKGIKLFGDRAIKGMTKELRQLHMRDSFIPRKKKDLTKKQWASRCEAVNLIKEKKSGEIKGRCCADGRSQRNYISKEESASPTVATESVLLTGVMEAKERRKVITLDVPNAFIQTYLEDVDERIILILRGIAVEMLIDIDSKYEDYVETENGKKVLYLECTNVIYGTIKAALLFYKKFRENIEAKGFVINPYDRCVANKMINGHQMTVLWHVDDLKASHVHEDVLNEFVDYLRGIYDDEEIGKIKVNYGPRHDFVGMVLDYSVPGKLIVDMKEYVNKMIEEFDYEIVKLPKTPAAEHLFKVNEKCEKLNNKMHEDFHTFVAKSLFLCKRARPEIQTAVAFMTTRVKEADKDDWKKLLRLMGYLKLTKELVLTLEADSFNMVKWFIDGSYAVHQDMRGHTGGGMTMGKGGIFGRSTKQKINTKSSTETELVAVDDILPQVLWTNYFMKAQGWNSYQTTIYQDNKSAILLENNGKLSSSNRTKHINVRYFFVKDCIERKEFKIEFCGTDDMWADFYTKPLQGRKFQEFRKIILNLEE